MQPLRIDCWSRGESIPPDRKPAEWPGRVLFLAADDHPDDIMLPRLAAAGADVTRVAAIRNNDFEYLSPLAPNSPCSGIDGFPGVRLSHKL